MPDDPSLSSRLARVEAELDALREQLRTRRVVVVDHDDVERVVLSAANRTGSVLVRIDGEPGRTTGLELYASALPDEDPVLGLVEVRDGDVIDDRLC